MRCSFPRLQLLGTAALALPAQSPSQSSTSPPPSQSELLQGFANRTGIYSAESCRTQGDLTFENHETVSVPSESGVSVRFQLLDPCGRPLPFICPSQFSVQAGPHLRHLGNGPHDESAVSVRGVRLRATDSSAQYVTLLVDSSISVDETERAEALAALLAFIDSYHAGPGATYMRILAFSGHTSRLLLTSGCTEGFCDDIDRLHAAIEGMEDSLAAWEDYDPMASAIFDAITDTVDELGVLARVHADAQDQSTRAVRTSDSLVIFTDLDHNAYYGPTLQSTLETIVAVHPSRGSISMVLFEPYGIDERDGDVMAAIDQYKQGFSETLGDDFVVAAADLKALESAFQSVADKVNAEANSWYEMFVCPPMRGGEANELVITVESGEAVQYTGSLRTTFDATGFSNTCPFHVQNGLVALEQKSHTSFCQDRDCGMYGGGVCGICAAPINDGSGADGYGYTIHDSHETLLFRYGAGADRPEWIDFTTSASSGLAGSVHVTAHVGAGRQLVSLDREGVEGSESFGGVTLTRRGDAGRRVTFDSSADAARRKDVLLHVIPPSHAATATPTQTVTATPHGVISSPPPSTSGSLAAAPMWAVLILLIHAAA